MQKYGFTDARDVLERASARETAARVAAGTLAKLLLRAARRRGPLPRRPDGLGRAPGDRAGPDPADLDAVDALRGALLRPAPRPRRWSPRSRPRPRRATRSGGVVEVVAYGVPVGLGSHVHWDRKLDAPAGPGAHEHPGREGRGDRRRVRGGRPARERGPRPDHAGTPRAGLPRETQPGRRHRGRHVHGRAARRPGGHEAAGHAEPARRCGPSTSGPRRRRSRSRSAPTSPPCRPSGVVAETMVALVLADEATRKFGGDSVAELVRNRDAFLGLREGPSLADGPEWRGPPRHVVLVGMMGVGQDDGRPTRAAAARPPVRRCRRASSSRSGRTVAEWFAERRASRRSATPRADARRRCSAARSRRWSPPAAASWSRTRTASACASAGVVVLARRRAGVPRHPGRKDKPPAAARRRPGRHARPPRRARGAWYARSPTHRAVEPPHEAERPSGAGRAVADSSSPRGGAEPATRWTAGPMIELEVPLGDRSYAVLVGSGARHRLLEVAARRRPRRAAVVTQAGIGVEVDPGVEHRTFPIGDGEDGQVPRHRRGPVPRLGPVGPRPGATSSSPSAAGSSPTPPGSPPPSTTGACRWCTCPPRCSARSTPPSAARPA